MHPGLPFTQDGKKKEIKQLPESIASNRIILSINRFEKKKNVELAVRSFARLVSTEKSLQSDLLLIVAGGYDVRLEENVMYLKQLQRLASSLSLTHQTFFSTCDLTDSPTSTERDLPVNKRQVIFLPSIEDSFKTALLHKAEILLYTPSNEHFGIVPLEAMLAASAVVIAINSGGPKETIEHEKSGFLTDPIASAVARYCSKVLKQSDGFNREEMLKAAKESVLNNFSISTFVEELFN